MTNGKLFEAMHIIIGFKFADKMNKDDETWREKQQNQIQPMI